MINLLRRRSEDLVNRARSALPSTREPLEAVSAGSDQLAEYRKLSASLGLKLPQIDGDLRIERFKAFLRAKDWLVFDLATVVAYMDEKAEAESAEKAGWHWRPLRDTDHIRDVMWGREASAWSSGNSLMGFGMQQFGGSGPSLEQNIAQQSYQRQLQAQVHRVSASDHYRGATMIQTPPRWGLGGETAEAPASATAYDKLVPLHALRKVAAIEAEFKEPVSFFVCDYAPAPHIEYPDPFLMAVINNGNLAKGVGRFVIDFWDEPGFGIDKQLA